MMPERPPFDYPLTQGKSCICAEGGVYRAYLDRNAAVEFLFSLHLFAQGQQQIGEEISIDSRNCGEIRCKGTQIGYVEFNLVHAHKHKKQGKTILKEPKDIRQTPHGKYRPEHDRLDYFISAEEAREAYETVAGFLSDESSRAGREVALFGNLVIRLVEL